MPDELKDDHIDIETDKKEPSLASRVYQRFSKTDKNGESSHESSDPPLFIKSRSLTTDRAAQLPNNVNFDEGFDAPREKDFRHKQIFRGWKLFLLAYQSTGVIYGDIGTSPLYVYSSTFTSAPGYDDLLGVLSIIIWSLTLILIVKYVGIVLNADNEGQGGTFALYSLLTRYANIATGNDPNKENMIRFERYKTGDIRGTNLRARTFFERSLAARIILCGVALFGVSLIMADGVLTPAQSVLGAIQGLTVIKPSLSNGTIVGITCAILVLLFVVQPLGVGKISFAFAPIVILWLLFNFCFGIYNLIKFDHSVLKAFSPYFAGLYFVRNKTDAWRSLGGILLCFTGVEALFADLGAFSKRAIQISAIAFAYPCLLFAYIGQAAYISVNPAAYSNPFFQTVPPGMFYPSLIVAILAAIVASQALITSAFQLLFQLTNTSYFPPVKMVYTSFEHHSQIYCPVANWLMMIGTVVVTAIFRDTTKLGNAYGVCVILDSVITTTLVAFVALIVWKIKWYFVAPLWLTYALLEGLYMTSALNKVPQGAWFTLTLAVVLATIFSIWRYGKESQWVSERKGRLPRLSKLVHKTDTNEVCLIDEFGGGELSSLKGLGIFFDKTGGDWVPTIYQEFVTKFEAQPGVQVFLHLRATTVPFVDDDDKFITTRTGLPNCYRMLVRYGYAESVMSNSLGEAVYKELKEYITKELLPDGRSSAYVNPDPSHGAKVYTKKQYIDEKLAEESQAKARMGHISAPMDAKQLSASPESNGLATKGFTENTIIDVSERVRRLQALEAAYKSQVLYIVGKTELLVPPSRNYLRRVILWAFLYIRDMTNAKSTSLRIPVNKMIEVGFIRDI